MMTLNETIANLSVKQGLDDVEHPVSKEEKSSALYYLRNYRDLIQNVKMICKDTEYIKHYLEDLEQ